MNKIVLGCMVLFFGILIFSFLYLKKSTKSIGGFMVQTYKIQGKELNLMIADTPKKWSQGLMFIKEKPKNVDGMIFLFPEKDYRVFWNQNTYLSLKLLWMDNEAVVGTDELPRIIETETPVTVHSREKVNRVVELIE